MNIAIIGAGIGGLHCARLLAAGGANVVVYEQRAKNALAYDWYDDVDNTVFAEQNIPIPDDMHFTFDTPTSFAVPSSSMIVRTFVKTEKIDWSIDRRRFSLLLLKLAEDAGAKFEFEKKVSGLIVGEKRVKGIDVDGKPVFYDIVIDSSGALSVFRASLPQELCIQPMPDKTEIFRAFRGMYTYAEGYSAPETDRKLIYLKHLGEAGVSWCFAEPNGEVNILVGRIGELTPESLDNAIKDLRQRHPLIGDTLLHGGDIYTIPVRYPLSKMVCDGYAAIGDCAFMTIPMIGSGIGNTLRAAGMLAETILKNGSGDAASLWEYEYRYMQKIGAESVFIDMIKRMILSMDEKDIAFLFEKEILAQDEIQGVVAGDEFKMNPAKLLDKLHKGRSNLGLLISLALTIAKAEKAQKHVLALPKVYNEKSVRLWLEKLSKLTRG